METKVVSCKTKDGEIRVVVGEETAIMRMRRARAKQAAINSQTGDEDADILRVVFYPDCIAAALEYVGFEKPTFGEFIALSGDFVDRWIDAVWQLNPSWRAGYEAPADEAEKKE